MSHTLKIYQVFILSWLLWLPSQLLAQDSSANGQRTIHTFDKKKIQKYKNDPAFQYKEVKRPSSPSFFYRLQEWLWRNFWEPLGNPDKHPIRSKIYYLLIALILLYAILKMINADLTGLFQRKPQSKITFTEVDENIHEMNFAKLIEDAKAKQNYRRAVRLLYLQSLKALSDKNLIHWEIDKTNHEYERELSKSPLQATFQELTLRFEYICYGDFQIDKALFSQTETLFEQFNARVSQTKVKPAQTL